MSTWCETQDVEARLKGLQAINYTGDDILVAIEEATSLFKSEVGSIVAQTVIDAWDAAITAVPPVIRATTSRLAAAYLLQDFVAGEVISDPQSKAGGLYRSYVDFVKRLQQDTSIIASSTTDNAPVSTGMKVITSSSTGKTRVFSLGNDGDDTTGTLDNF